MSSISSAVTLSSASASTSTSTSYVDVVVVLFVAIALAILLCEFFYFINARTNNAAAAVAVARPNRKIDLKRQTLPSNYFDNDNDDYFFKTEIRGGDEGIKVLAGTGFYSCCSVRLHSIIKYYNYTRHLPAFVDSSAQFSLYYEYLSSTVATAAAAATDGNKVFFGCFEDNASKQLINLPLMINYHHSYQFIDFRDLAINTLLPIVRKYFSPTREIRGMARQLINKYNIDCSRTCTLFYRGLDKSTECRLPSYDEVYARAMQVHVEHPYIDCFLLQSDDATFIETLSQKLKKCFRVVVFHAETRMIAPAPKKGNQVDMYYYNHGMNFTYAKWFLASMLVMSRTRQVVLNSGNCSLWLCLFRGDCHGIHQYIGDHYVP